MNSTAASQRRDFKWQLLASVSAFAMLASLSGAQAQDAPPPSSDDSHIWVELGGQLTDFATDSTTFFNDPTTPGSAQLIGPSGGWDADAKFSFQPADSDWIFSVAARYGRTNPKNFFGSGTVVPATTDSTQRYYTGFVSHKESHAIIDFTVGKDFGLGMFGQKGSSIFSLGVRFAQFQARTDIGYYTGTISSTSFAENAHISRSFNGVGPVIAWDASAPLSGDFNSQLSIDWGANASVLFGKQKVSLSATYSPGTPYSVSRHNSVTVPSVGGYLALSWHGGEGTKISLGYRADEYFNALDGGFDTAAKINRAFYGPFIKIGISD
jgi:Legionella pneumophila major outer membrane protein precursor